MEQQSAALRAMNDAVLAIAAEATIEPMLQRLAHAARGLVDAEYAAIGVPDGEGGFAQFITSGMSDELIAAMGPLPRQHGLLGAMLTSPVPYLTSDVRRDPRFRGWWPSAHPQMRSFLGVPIVAASGIVGAIYLTDKVGAEEFDEADQQLIEMLAVHAALAIEKANLYERSRELSIVEERNRLARELHDSVTQKLFGLTLTAEAAATVIDRDTAEAKAQLRRLQELTREAMEELRSLIFELRPPEAESEGLATALRKHVDVLQSVHGDAVALSLEGDAEPRAGAAEVLRIAQEALQNALRHAHATARRRPARRDRRAPARRRGRRRRRLRPRRARPALAPPRPDLDGGARPRARRHAEHRLAPGRRDDRRARGAAVIRVLIADDHAVVREGLRAFLALQDDVEVVGEAADGEEAVQAVVRLEPDVALVDLVMPRVDGIEAIGRIRAERPQTRVIVLTSFVDEDKMLPAVRAGAVGYLLKDVAPQDLVSAIRTVHGGGTLLHPTVVEELVREVSRDGAARRRPTRSTAREREVLALIARGRANKAIAFELGVAEKTVKTHVSNILGKLGLTDRTQAALYAVREGLVDAEPREAVLGPIPDTGPAAPGVRVGVMASTAIITGASRGLGLALARALAARQWRLVIDARGADALEAARRELAAHTDVTALVGDVADERHRRALVTAAGDRIDALVNNASILGPSPQPALDAYPLDVLEDVLKVNALAPLRLIQLALPAMPDGARIVNVTSDAAVEAYEGWGGYGSSKAALEQLTNVLARRAPDARRLRLRPGRHEHRAAPGGVPGRGHLRSPAARGQRARAARAARPATCPAGATATPT